MMVINMNQIKMIVQFFKTIAQREQLKGIKNLIEKIEYFDEEDKILSEKPFTGQLEDQIVDEHDKVIRYYLLLK